MDENVMMKLSKTKGDQRNGYHGIKWHTIFFQSCHNSPRAISEQTRVLSKVNGNLT